MKDDRCEKRLSFVQLIAKDIKRKVATIAICLYYKTILSTDLQ